MRHCIIGSNIMDRLVKCPGSLVIGQGSLKEYDKKRAKITNVNDIYVKNRIECNEQTKFGEKVDEVAKNYMRWKYGVREKHKYTNGVDEIDPNITKPARKYYEHIYKVRQRFTKGSIDPSYSMDKYMSNLPDCEFRVTFNPDFIACNNYNGTVFVSDLTTGSSYNRNKMFQVICCAVGIISNYPEVTACICEVFNAVTDEVMISKFSREELEAYRDDIIIPTLNLVKAALSSDDIEEYRHNCSWCRSFCKCKDAGCKACGSGEMVENEVPIHLDFYTDIMSDATKEAYRNMFIES